MREAPLSLLVRVFVGWLVLLSYTHLTPLPYLFFLFLMSTSVWNVRECVHVSILKPKLLRWTRKRCEVAKKKKSWLSFLPYNVWSELRFLIPSRFSRLRYLYNPTLYSLSLSLSCLGFCTLLALWLMTDIRYSDCTFSFILREY